MAQIALKGVVKWDRKKRKRTMFVFQLLTALFLEVFVPFSERDKPHTIRLCAPKVHERWDSDRKLLFYRIGHIGTHSCCYCCEML